MYVHRTSSGPSDRSCDGLDTETEAAHEVVLYKIEHRSKKPPNQAESEEFQHAEPYHSYVHRDSGSSVVENQQDQGWPSSHTTISQDRMSLFQHDFGPYDQDQHHSFRSTSDEEEIYQLMNVPPSNQQSPTALTVLDVTAPSLDEISAPSSPISNPNTNQADIQTTKLHPPILRWWYLDILATVTAIASLATIIGVLVAYDGKSQDAWPSKVLTINGLVAILATFCRGAFMTSVASVLSQEKWNRFSESANRLEDFALLDGASRGLWGSLQLFWKLRPV